MALTAGDIELIKHLVQRYHGDSVQRIFQSIAAVQAAVSGVVDTLPVVPVTFITPEYNYTFTSSQADFTFYRDDPSNGDTISFGANGFTITHRPKDEMELEPQFNGYARQVGMVPGTDIIVTKIAVSNNYATDRRYAVIALRWDAMAHLSGNFSDCPAGCLFVEAYLQGSSPPYRWGLRVVLSTGIGDIVNTGILVTNAIDVRIQYAGDILTISYRQNGASEWTQLYNGAYALFNGYFILAGEKPQFTEPDETLTVYSVLVGGVAAISTLYAFILTADYQSFRKNWVYIQKSDGTYQKIDPSTKPGLIVLSTNDSLLYTWSGTAWVTRTHLLANASALGMEQTILEGEDGFVLRCIDATHAALARLHHDDLANILPDQHHNQLHAPTHSNGGGDEVTVENLGTNATNGRLLQSANNGGLRMVNPSVLPHLMSSSALLALLLSEV